MEKIKLFTIGFTKKKAEQFFSLIQESGVKRIVDIRLNNVSQLAGFAKRDDLRYFLKAICNIDYVHLPELAPTKEILNDFKKSNGDWSIYEKKFKVLLAERIIEKRFEGIIRDGDCFLCSEETPEQCHRRLVAEYLQKSWGNIEIEHII